MDPVLPRILSPNLGCPVLTSPEKLLTEGMHVVIAESVEIPPEHYELMANPSYFGDGQLFDFQVEGRRELTDSGLPPRFNQIEETRFLFSTTLKSSILAGKARFVLYTARTAASAKAPQLRAVCGEPRITIYDLVLKKGGKEIFTAFHALALRPSGGNLRFIHATDLHVALRNDTYEVTLNTSPEASIKPAGGPFINFNKNLRSLIQHANELADQGRLDFVLMLGDLVDFVRHNYSDRDDFGENNWKLFRSIIMGTDGPEGCKGKSPGLKVPLFTSTGNHDWRLYPYPPAVNSAAYGLNKAKVKFLDPFWADDPGELSRKTKEFYDKMIGEGSLLSNIMLGSKYLHKVGDWMRNWRDKLTGPSESGKVRSNVLGWLLPRMATWQIQLLAPLSALPIGRVLGKTLEVMAIAAAVVSAVMNGIIGAIKFLVRQRSPDLMALEAGWEALNDYFLTINPYFNYAFRIDHNYFLIMDTGYDCLRAQRFWDDGRKKLGPLSIKDNILGGSPDSMGFYDANEFYPYSQIAWMENLLRLVSDTEQRGGPAHVFVGLHAPPINLSKKQHSMAKADNQLTGRTKETPLAVGRYNIRYGSVNHYLSQFLHLCLGRSEGHPENQCHRVTMVLAGHAHWTLECCLRWDLDPNHQKPAIFYGDYTGSGNSNSLIQNCLQERWPLLLQTPAVGPQGDDPIAPPLFRLIEVDEKGTVTQAQVHSLNQHDKASK